jgi:hypothetical protein
MKEKKLFDPIVDQMLQLFDKHISQTLKKFDRQ